jgi:hypothetical protein
MKEKKGRLRMPKAKSDSSNRSEFIRSCLRDNAKMSHREVQKVWTQKGGELPITGSLYYQIKAAMFGRRRRRRRSPGRVAPAASTANESTHSYQSIEEALDQLLVKAMALRDLRLVSALRIARRCASAKLL